MRYLPFLLVLTGLTFFVRDHAFFWDTIQLGSKHAHWFYEQSFQYLLLPPEIDSGHPPIFGMYLAAMWMFFGQSLWVSHFAMLPFLWGIVFLLFQLGDYYLEKKRAFWLPLVVLLDPVFAGQSVLVSPDVVLICFFILAWWAVLKEKKGWLILAALGLAMVSMRGMMVVVVVYLFEVGLTFLSSEHLFKKNTILQNLRIFIKKALPYVPSGLFALAFFAFHYYETGWIAYHPDSPWAGSFQAVNFQGFLKNIAVLAWRMLEFGRFVIWAIFLFIILKLIRQRTFKKWWAAEETFKFKQLLILLGLSALILLPSMLRYTGLMQNRYLLPIFIILNITVLTFIFSTASFFKNKKFYTQPFIYLLVVALATGNLWIYPRKVSQGWDSTLAHLPYYDLRLKMIHYVDDQAIPYEKVGTRFPNIGSFQEKDLRGSTTGFPKANFSKHEYIFYSNIMNDFSDEEMETLERDWKVEQSFSSSGIEVVLYHKN